MNAIFLIQTYMASQPIYNLYRNHVLNSSWAQLHTRSVTRLIAKALNGSWSKNVKCSFSLQNVDKSMGHWVVKQSLHGDKVLV